MTARAPVATTTPSAWIAVPSSSTGAGGRVEPVAHSEQPPGVQVLVVGFQGERVLADITGQELLRTAADGRRAAASHRRRWSARRRNPAAQRLAADSPASEAPITATLSLCRLAGRAGGRRKVGHGIVEDDVDHTVDDDHLVGAPEASSGSSTAPGTQVETRGVQRAFDLAALQPTVGERRVLMRAGVDREHLAVVGVEDRDRWIGFDPPRLTAGSAGGQISSTTLTFPVGYL